MGALEFAQFPYISGLPAAMEFWLQMKLSRR
jgi:hypothetical protein